MSWEINFILWFQRGISYIKELKKLIVLDIYISRISTGGIREALWCEERPSLQKLCLPDLKLSEKDLRLLITMAPNLYHLGTKYDNLIKIRVRNFFMFSVYSSI